MQEQRAMISLDDRAHERLLAAYDQNAQTFRALNQLMWQIPLIAMTLTGGLWFGVAKAESAPVFQLMLLIFAAAGNIGLAVALVRLRFVMQRYLDWLQAFDPHSFVDADSKDFAQKPRTIRDVFRFMLWLAAAMSLGLALAPAKQIGLLQMFGAKSARADAVAFYDKHAADLADRYESLPFETAHPELAIWLRQRPSLRVLDIGAGTGRDAAWMAAAGHQVTAAEPSEPMRRLARMLHPEARVRWLDSRLPDLSGVAVPDERFDAVLMSAVWMHVHPRDRRAAMARVASLLAPGGRAYVTLRSGPADPARAIYVSSTEELKVLAEEAGLTYADRGEGLDLLGRPEVTWRSVVLFRPVD